ncbi:hypothetical protein acdb102_10050 [Acidothermaceae bacterium B102]|nr:hypothetical protein acdb102_10050 [Acidothermaceae bacterium B102]
MTEPHSHVVHNGKREMTIDELAASQPGMDRLMAEVGPRMHRLYYAASAGNWRLATYFYNSVIKQLRLSAFSRPKYEAEMATYIDDDCEPVRVALRDRDSSAFATSYAAMVERGNFYHGVFGKPYIAWKTPTSPPEDLDLTAGMGDAEA